MFLPNYTVGTLNFISIDHQKETYRPSSTVFKIRCTREFVTQGPGLFQEKKTQTYLLACFFVIVDYFY